MHHSRVGFQGRRAPANIAVDVGFAHRGLARRRADGSAGRGLCIRDTFVDDDDDDYDGLFVFSLKRAPCSQSHHSTPTPTHDFAPTDRVIHPKLLFVDELAHTAHETHVLSLSVAGVRPGNSVREKLDDPKYASWFIKFKDYKGRASNGSYHVPSCDWYNNGTAPRCSGFWHDHDQTAAGRQGRGPRADSRPAGPGTDRSGRDPLFPRIRKWDTSKCNGGSC